MIKDIAKYVLLVIVLMIPFFFITQVRADSGWDSGYDGGGYSTGGGSYGGGINSSSDSSGFSVIGFVFVVIIFLIVAVIKITYDSISNVRADIMDSVDGAYNDISEDKLKAILPNENIDEIKQTLFNKYLEIQSTCSSLNEEKLKKLCDEEINIIYLDKVKEAKKKNLMNIKCGFEILKLNLIGIKEENNEIVATIFLKTKYLDYVINPLNEELISGSKEDKVTSSYVINFVYVNNEFILRNERNVK